MSDRKRFRRTGAPQLPQERFDALKAVTGHDWLLGGPWWTLEPAVVAVLALGYGEKLSPDQRARWQRVADMLGDETNAALGMVTDKV